MASVRAEEFINYFDYDYAVPEEGAFAVSMDSMVHPFSKRTQILRVGVKGKSFSAETRPPLRLTFLVDVSGSMSSSDKLPLAQQAMHLLVDTLGPQDSVALATYAGRTARVLEPTTGRNKAQIHRAIDALSSGGGTAMGSGLELAYEMAWEAFEPGAENRVMVLSDGDANIGRTGVSSMLSTIRGYADRGVTMSTIGFGMGNYQDTRMEQLANNGDGSSHYVDGLAEASKLFVEDFCQNLIGIARDVKLQVEFDPAQVESYRLIGYENRDIADNDFRNDRVDAGEVGAGHSVTALYELRLSEHSSRAPAVTTRVRYEQPGPDSVATERTWSISGKALKRSRPSQSLQRAFVAGAFAEHLRRSPFAASSSLQELSAYAAKRLSKDAEDQELLTLIRSAAHLQKSTVRR